MPNNIDGSNLRSPIHLIDTAIKRIFNEYDDSNEGPSAPQPPNSSGIKSDFITRLRRTPQMVSRIRSPHVTSISQVPDLESADTVVKFTDDCNNLRTTFRRETETLTPRNNPPSYDNEMTEISEENGRFNIV